MFLAMTAGLNKETVMQRYNEMLFRRDSTQQFSDAMREWEAIVEAVTADGRLHVRMADGAGEAYVHGAVQWVWGR